MPSQPASSSELQRLWKSAQDELNRALDDCVREAVGARASQAGFVAYTAALGDLRKRLADLNAIADLLGRRRLMLELDAARRFGHFSEDRWTFAAGVHADAHPIPFDDPASSVPKVSFKDAVRELTRREPRLAATAAEVAEAYKEHSFSAVNAINETILKRVQAEIGNVIETGTPFPDAAEIVAKLAGWRKAYAHTVVRTNVTNAYVAGRFAQLRDPEVRRVVPALRFVSVQEPWNPKERTGTRPNHAACHGLIAAVDDPLWNEIAPPLGYNCRCTVALVTRGMLEAKGLLLKNGDVRKATKPPKGGPDAGFTHAGRPDLGVYS